MNYLTITPDLKETGQRLKQLFEQNGMSVRDVQELLELESVQSVYKWLWGLSMPSIDHLLMIAALFHTTLDDIVVGKEKMIMNKKTFMNTKATISNDADLINGGNTMTNTYEVRNRIEYMIRKAIQETNREYEPVYLDPSDDNTSYSYTYLRNINSDIKYRWFKTTRSDTEKTKTVTREILSEMLSKMDSEQKDQLLLDILNETLTYA